MNPSSYKMCYLILFLLFFLSSGFVNSVFANPVDTGEYHTCAVLSTGQVKCWGNNSTGQLGNGTLTQSPTPITVPGISTAIAVSAGMTHTCVSSPR